MGLCAALLVTLAARTATGEAAFAAWGWRLPFLASAGLLAISLWIRLSLAESPAFERLEAQGGRSAAPFRDAFADLPNLRRVLIALFSMMVAQGAVWYCAFFYAQVFIEKVIHVQPALVNLMTLAIVVVSAPLYVLFGWLSDRIGRKWVMTLGTLLTTAAIVPGFHLITAYANPALARAQASTPVTVLADSGDLLAAVRSRGQGAVPHRLRHRQGRPDRGGRLLQQPARRAGCGRTGEGRRGGDRLAGRRGADPAGAGQAQGGDGRADRRGPARGGLSRLGGPRAARTWRR